MRVRVVRVARRSRVCYTDGPVRHYLSSRFADLSIRDKLLVAILGSTLPPLAVGFGFVIFTNLQLFRDDWVENVDLVTKGLSSYLALALAFDDPEEARRGMTPLIAIDSVVDIFLYDADGQIFEEFNLFGEAATIEPPPAPETPFVEVRGDFVHCSRPVVFEGKRYGTVYVLASAEPYHERSRAYLVQTGGLLSVLVALAVFGAYAFQRPITRPILRLAAAARQISEKGDYSVRVEKEGEDEIGTLYDGFHAMLEQIEQRQEDLERSNRDLDQFAYVASHDLKAPLRAISTLSAWIEEDLEDRLGEESREQMRLLRGRVERMDRLIEGILRYSRVGRMDSAGEVVDVGAMLRDLVVFLAPPEGFRVEIGDGMPTFVARRLRLEQVFQNLISNAIKYHHRPHEGLVRVTSREHGAFYEFSVIDDGPGIDPRYHGRIFQIFQTLHARDEMESTGLGLSLVSKLVDEEGGDVSVDSEIGCGATFSFTWPRTPSTSPLPSSRHNR